jgi:major membrane immunogen (membrane-anchored lipoprotein)
MLPSLSFYRGTSHKTHESIRNWKDFLIPITIKDGDIKSLSDVYKFKQEKQWDNNGYDIEPKNSDNAQG